MSPDYRPDPDLYPGDVMFIDVTLRATGPDDDPYGGARYGRPGGTPPLLPPLGGRAETRSVDSVLVEFTDGPIDPPPAGG